MTTAEFASLFNSICKSSEDTLISKRMEYAGDNDVLHNFHAAGAAQSIPPTQALVGMMTKHFISVSDMSKCPESYNIEKWQEKLGDLRNYTFLLEALLIDCGIK